MKIRILFTVFIIIASVSNAEDFRAELQKEQDSQINTRRKNVELVSSFDLIINDGTIPIDYPEKGDHDFGRTGGFGFKNGVVYKFSIWRNGSGYGVNVNTDGNYTNKDKVITAKIGPEYTYRNGKLWEAKKEIYQFYLDTNECYYKRIEIFPPDDYAKTMDLISDFKKFPNLVDQHKNGELVVLTPKKNECKFNVSLPYDFKNY